MMRPVFSSSSSPPQSISDSVMRPISAALLRNGKGLPVRFCWRALRTVSEPISVSRPIPIVGVGQTLSFR